MIPFIFSYGFSPQGFARQTHWYLGLQSWFITDLFPSRSPEANWGSTSDKQTSKGLFICIADLHFKLSFKISAFLFRALFSPAVAVD
jgi:hypothetical protein